MKGTSNGLFPCFRVKKFAQFYLLSPLDLQISENEFKVENFFFKIAFSPNRAYLWQNPVNFSGRKFLLQTIQRLGLVWKNKNRGRNEVNTN